MKRGLFILIIFVFLIKFSSASYISGDIYLAETGSSRLELQTDKDLQIQGIPLQNNKISGTTDLLTNKEKGAWTFELNLQEYNSTFIEIHLPKNMKSIIRIDGKDYLLDIDKKIITLLSPYNFKVSYTLEETANYLWLVYLAILLFVVALFIIYKKIRRKKEHLEHIMPLINENEQRIIDLLMKSPKRQKEIRKTLNIPKASFSRYLINLEKKKLIVREGEGKNKIVKLK